MSYPCYQEPAVFIKKYSKTEIEPDFIGFNLDLDRRKLKKCGLSDCWLFGYGFDYYGHYREMEHIGWVEMEIFAKDE